ncbi:MAG: ABC transporter permease [Candidatus Marinimicrobia bacterium]|nr:ABC transporter permease [Candidatus Neomarinimicrobiota bacterium]
MLQLKLEKRLSYNKKLDYMVPALSMLFALIAGSFVFWINGANPFEAYKEMFIGAFGDGYSISETLVQTTPLLFTGLAVSLTLRTLLWNIGAEGQFFMGAMGATWAAQTFSNQPPWILIPLLMLSAAVAGALWGLPPAILKTKLHVNEILTTLLLNYVAIFYVNYLLYGPWKDPRYPGFPQTPRYPDAALLHQYFNTRLSMGILIGIILAVILYVLYKKTGWGYKIQVIGQSRKTAKYAGIRVNRNIIRVLMISGAIAGLGGMLQISGLHHKLRLGGISNNYGYTGIIIAFLANGNPLAVIFVALFMGALLVGGDSLQMTMGFGKGVVHIFEGMVLFFVLAGEALKTYKITVVKND